MTKRSDMIKNTKITKYFMQKYQIHDDFMRCYAKRNDILQKQSNKKLF